MIKAVLFDCFGVLLTDALQIVRDKHAESDPVGAADIQAIVASANLGIISRAESNKRVANILGISVEEFRSQIDIGEVRNTALFSHILNLRKNYKTAMLSNISRESLDRRFASDELTSYFDAVITSGEAGYVKPSPEIYEIAAERLSLRCDECIFVDDRERFVDGARAVGMQAFVYVDFEQFQSDLQNILQRNA